MPVKIVTQLLGRIQYYDTLGWHAVTGVIPYKHKVASWTHPVWKHNAGAGVDVLAWVGGKGKEDGHAGSGMQAKYSIDNGVTWPDLTLTTDSTTGDRAFAANAVVLTTSHLIYFTHGYYNTEVTPRHRVISRVFNMATLVLDATISILPIVDYFFYTDTDNPDTTRESDIAQLIQFPVAGSTTRVLAVTELGTVNFLWVNRGTISSTSYNTISGVKPATLPIHGQFSYAMPAAAADGLFHCISIYGDGKATGTVKWVHFTVTDQNGNGELMVNTDTNLFPGKVYDVIPDGLNLTGGAVSCFYDRDASLIHVWMKNGTAINNSIYYRQIDVSLANFNTYGEFRMSDVNLVMIDEDVDHRTWAIHGGAQDGKIYLVLHRDDESTIQVYRKRSNADWRLVDHIVGPGFEELGIAWLVVDYDTPTGDVFVATDSPDTFLDTLEATVNAGLHDLVIEQGALKSELVTWLDEDGTVHDLTSYGAKLSAKVGYDDASPLFILDSPNQLVITAVDGQIEIRMTESDTDGLTFSRGIYDLLVYPPLTGTQYLIEAVTDFTSAAINDDSGSSRGAITLTGGTFVTTDFPVGAVVHIYNAEDAINEGVFTVYSITSTIMTLTEVLGVDNATDTTIKIQRLDADNVVRLIEGNVFLSRTVTTA